MYSAHRLELGQELVQLGEPEPLPAEALEKLLYRCQKVVDAAEGKSREKHDLQKKITDVEGEIKRTRTKFRPSGTWKTGRLTRSQAIRPLGLPGETSPARSNR